MTNAVIEQEEIFLDPPIEMYFGNIVLDTGLVTLPRILCLYWPYLEHNGERMTEQEFALLVQVIVLKDDLDLRVVNLPMAAPSSSLERSKARLRRMGLLFTERNYYPSEPGRSPRMKDQAWDLRSLMHNLVHLSLLWREEQAKLDAEWLAGGKQGARPIYRIPADFHYEIKLPVEVALDINQGRFYPVSHYWMQIAGAIVDNLPETVSEQMTTRTAQDLRGTGWEGGSRTMQNLRGTEPENGIFDQNLTRTTQDLHGTVNENCPRTTQNLRGTGVETGPTAQIPLGTENENCSRTTQILRGTAVKNVVSGKKSARTVQDLRGTEVGNCRTTQNLRGHLSDSDQESESDSDEEVNGAAADLQPVFTYFARRRNIPQYMPSTKEVLALQSLLAEGYHLETEILAGIDLAFERAKSPIRSFVYCAQVIRQARKQVDRERVPEPVPLEIPAEFVEAVQILTEAINPPDRATLTYLAEVAKACDKAARAEDSTGAEWVTEAIIESLGRASPQHLLPYTRKVLQDWTARGRCKTQTANAVEVDLPLEVTIFHEATGRIPLRDQIPMVTETIRKHNLTAPYLRSFWEEWILHDRRRTDLTWLNWAVTGGIPDNSRNGRKSSGVEDILRSLSLAAQKGEPNGNS